MASRKNKGRALAGERPADRSAAAGNLRRQHTMRNDTADMMKTVQRPDGSHVAPTNRAAKPNRPRRGEGNVAQERDSGAARGQRSRSALGGSADRTNAGARQRPPATLDNAGAAAALGRRPNAPHPTDKSSSAVRGSVKPFKKPPKGHHVPPALRPVTGPGVSNAMAGRPGSASHGRTKAQVQTSASGARYVVTPSGKKRYLGNKVR